MPLGRPSDPDRLRRSCQLVLWRQCRGLPLPLGQKARGRAAEASGSWSARPPSRPISVPMAPAARRPLGPSPMATATRSAASWGQARPTRYGTGRRRRWCGTVPWSCCTRPRTSWPRRPRGWRRRAWTPPRTPCALAPWRSTAHSLARAAGQRELQVGPGEAISTAPCLGRAARCTLCPSMRTMWASSTWPRSCLAGSS